MLHVHVKCENLKSYQFIFNEEDKVEVLYQKFNGRKELKFFYNIVLMSPSMTFSFYKIKSGAYIYCFDTKSTKLISDSSKQIYIENVEKLRMMREVKFEETRLRDLFLHRITNEPRKKRNYFIKICQRTPGKPLNDFPKQKQLE